MTITPLRKETENGELYRRNDRIESLLIELSSLSHDDLIERAGIAKRTHPDYVPSECLLYFIRASRDNNGTAWFERLYRILAERILRRLPTAQSRDGKTILFTEEAIRDEVFGRFVELLSVDRQDYAEELDYFEIRFDSALANMRRDAQDKAWRAENRSRPLYDEESGEISPEVEAETGIFDPFATFDFVDADYRSRLAAAIDTLPPEQRRIIHMLKLGFPIDSKDPDTMTIAKALRRSEKTIRTHRDKAFAALRISMNDGEHL